MVVGDRIHLLGESNEQRNEPRKKRRRSWALLLALMLPFTLTACSAEVLTGDFVAYAVDKDGRKSLILYNNCGWLKGISIGPGWGDGWVPFSKVEISLASPPLGMFTFPLDDLPDYATFKRGSAADLPITPPFYVMPRSGSDSNEKIIVNYEPTPGHALVLEGEIGDGYVSVPIVDVELRGEDCTANTSQTSWSE